MCSRRYDQEQRTPCRLMDTFTRQQWPCSMQSLLLHGGEVTLIAPVKLSRPEASAAVHEVVSITLLLIFAYFHPVLFPFFVTSPYFLERVVIGPIYYADARLERALEDSVNSYEALWDTSFDVFSRLVKLMSELISTNFTMPQRRISHNKGSRQLVKAYSTAIGIVNKAKNLVSEAHPKNINYSRHFLMENICSNFARRRERLYLDCPESIEQIPYPIEVVSQ